MNDTPAITLEQLRSQLTDDQRAILNAIWEHYEKETGDKRWIRTRLLHHRFGATGSTIVPTALKQLGGSYAYEQGYGADKLYQLTLLGVLLTDQGREAAELLARYLEHVQERFSSDPNVQQVKDAEVETALGLTKEKSRFLRHILSLSRFYAGGGFGETWYALVPDDVDELPSVQDFRAYVQARALERLDPNLPF